MVQSFVGDKYMLMFNGISENFGDHMCPSRNIVVQ